MPPSPATAPSRAPRRVDRVAAWLTPPRAGALLTAYLGALALIAFWPRKVDSAFISPFRRVVLHFGGDAALFWNIYNVVEVTANVLLFVPIGLLATRLLRGRGAGLKIALLGLAASTAIEVGQGLFLGGRTSSITDIVANGLGAALGALVATALRGSDRGAETDDVSPDERGERSRE